MKKKGKYPIWFFLILITYSCSDYNRSNIEVINDFPEEVVLIGENWLKDEYGTIELSLADSFILLRKMKEPFFSVYDLITNEKIGNFGKSGKGPKEFGAPRYLGQLQDIDSLNAIWVLDRMHRKFHLMDLNKSLLNNEIIKLSEYELPKDLSPVYLYNINSTLFIGNKETDHSIFLYNYTNHSKELMPLTVKYSKRGLSFNDKRKLNFIHCGLKPDQKKMVSVFYYFPRIDIYEIIDLNTEKSMKHSSAYLTDKMPKKINSRSIENMDIINFYQNVFVTNNYIYLLKLNQPDKDLGEVEKNVLIQVMDWSGNITQQFELDKYILNFIVDEKNGVIYGLNYLKDELYKFSLDNPGSTHLNSKDF